MTTGWSARLGAELARRREERAEAQVRAGAAEQDANSSGPGDTGGPVPGTSSQHTLELAPGSRTGPFRDAVGTPTIPRDEAWGAAPRGS